MSNIWNRVRGGKCSRGLQEDVCACTGQHKIVKTRHTKRCGRFKKKENQPNQAHPASNWVLGVSAPARQALYSTPIPHINWCPQPLKMEGYGNTRLQTHPIVKYRPTDQGYTQTTPKDHVYQVRKKFHQTSKQNGHSPQQPPFLPLEAKKGSGRKKLLI